MEKICTYNELDNFTGSISHNSADLPKLVSELKLACLLYDRVVLHSNNILEHPLTLPACEILYPFVRSGKLWTTTDFREKAPIDFIEKRSELFLGDILKKQGGSLRGLSKKRNLELTTIIERWKAIIPDEFHLRRDISLQVKTALTNLEHPAFSMLKYSKIKAAYKMLDVIEKMKADHKFDREKLFAWLGNLKGLILPQYISDMAITVQKSFLVDGAKQHGKEGAKVWFGQFTQKLQQANIINSFDSDNITFSLIEMRFKKIGLDLNWLLSLSAENLFEIANSIEWKNFRDLVLNDKLNIVSHQEIIAYLEKIKSPAKKLETLLININISPLILPSAWSLSSLALLGYEHHYIKQEYKYILDLTSHTIYHIDFPNKIINLKITELHLLSLLANAGEIGLYEEHIKQLDIELEQLERVDHYEPVHYFIKEDHIENRLNKLAQVKTRLNKKLKEISLIICVKNMNGHWYIGDLKEQYKTVKLKNTIWESAKQIYSENYIPKNLSNQLQVTWKCLWEYATAFVNWQKISTLITNENEELEEERKIKRVSDAINKLEKAIIDESYLVLKDYCGNYRICSKENTPKN